MDQYWHAQWLRENISHTYKACYRSCYQRLHEVVRLMDAMRKRVAESKVTTERVLAEYNKNLTNMDMDSDGAVSNGFLKIAVTVARRMLAVPEIADIMREADGKAFTTFNPWGNHTRLQAMIDKCQTSDLLIWCCQALAFKVSQGQLTSMSALDIRGGAIWGGRQQGHLRRASLQSVL